MHASCCAAHHCFALASVQCDEQDRYGEAVKRAVFNIRNENITKAVNKVEASDPDGLDVLMK